MKGMGWTLIAIAGVLVLWSCFMSTSVHTGMKYLPGVGLEEAKDVYNLGLLQRQMMLLHSGLALLIAGTIAVCVAQLRDAMRRAGTANFIGIWETESAPPVSTAGPVSKSE